MRPADPPVRRSPDPGSRFRAGACLVMAGVGIVVAGIAPSTVAEGEPATAVSWVVLTVLGGVVALLLVAAANAVGPRRTDRMRSGARAGVLVGCLVPAVFLLVLASVADEAVREDALALAPMALPFPLVAVLLGVVTVRLDGQR